MSLYEYVIGGWHNVLWPLILLIPQELFHLTFGLIIVLGPPITLGVYIVSLGKYLRDSPNK